MRHVQHKKEAFWFYRFLSIFYDHYVNPFFWTRGMRDTSLALARLDRRDLRVVDVGSGTGFTTQGIARHVDAAHIDCIDQSPHQMAHARRKSDLHGARFQQGDAEELPFADDHFDRYVSAGSIEYWPEPQRGIAEAYRVIKPGGVALMVGPLRPQNRVGRWLADTWMLFPEEDTYVRWFRDAGFVDIEKCYVAPHWVMKEKYGIALCGVKPAAGPSPLVLPERKREDVDAPMSFGRRIAFVWRLVIGNLAGFLFIPMAVGAHFLAPLRRLLGKQNSPGVRPPEPLTAQQRISLLVIGALLVIALWYIFA